MHNQNHPPFAMYGLALFFIFSVSEFNSEFKVIPPPVTQWLLFK